MGAGDRFLNVSDKNRGLRKGGNQKKKKKKRTSLKIAKQYC